MPPPPEDKTPLANWIPKCDSGPGSAYVLSSDWSIGPLLSRGCLLPVAYGDSTDSDFFDRDHRNFLLVTGKAIPKDWCEALRASVKNIHPIALRCDASVLEEDRDGFTQAHRGIIIDEVEALVFPSEKEKEQFVSQKYSDYDLEDLDIELRVDSKVFKGTEEDAYRPITRELADGVSEEPPTDQESESVVESSAGDPDVETEVEKKPTDERTSTDSNGGPEETTEIKVEEKASRLLSKTDDTAVEGATPDLRRADGRAALRAVLIQEAPGKVSWIEDAYARCWSREKSSGSKASEWIGAILDGLSADEATRHDSIDLAVLSATSYLMWSEFNKATGWPAKKVLERIVAETKKRSSTRALEKEGKIFKAWEERAYEILGDEEKCIPLEDKKSVGMRAALFLLLRGDLNSILETEVNSEEGIKVGMHVRLLAACLTAIRFGLRALPSKYKKSDCPTDRRSWLAVLGASIVEELGLREFIDSGIEIKPPGKGVLEGGRWELRRKGRRAGERLVLKPRDIDTDLSLLIAQARDLKYEIELHGDDGLKISVKINGDRQVVYLATRWVDPASPQRLVSFWAKAEDLSLPSGKNKGALNTTAAKRITLKMKADLLELNADKDRGCYFAVDLEEKALTVTSSQLLSTMDVPEFCYHLNNVARRAAEYGKGQKRLKKR